MTITTCRSRTTSSSPASGWPTMFPRLGQCSGSPTTAFSSRRSTRTFCSAPRRRRLARAARDPGVAGARGGVLQVHSERQSAYDVGFQQGLGSHLRLDVDFWERHSEFSGDQDQFLNTGIVFPLAFQSGTFHGWNVRLDLGGDRRRERLPLRRPHSGDLRGSAGRGTVPGRRRRSMPHRRPVSSSTMTRICRSRAAWTYDFGKSGFWVGTNVRYDSGLVTDADPATLAGGSRQCLRRAVRSRPLRGRSRPQPDRAAHRLRLLGRRRLEPFREVPLSSRWIF